MNQKPRRSELLLKLSARLGCLRHGHSLACMWDGGHVCLHCKDYWRPVLNLAEPYTSNPAAAGLRVSD